MKCDDCGKEVQGSCIYYKGKDRCWKCDEKFDKELNSQKEQKPKGEEK